MRHLPILLVLLQASLYSSPLAAQTVTKVGRLVADEGRKSLPITLRYTSQAAENGHTIWVDAEVPLAQLPFMSSSERATCSNAIGLKSRFIGETWLRITSPRVLNITARGTIETINCFPNPVKCSRVEWLKEGPLGLPRPNVEWFDCNSPIAAQVQQVPVQGDFEFEAVNLQTVHERSTSQPPSLSAPNALAALGGDDLRLILAELSRRTFLPSSLGAPTSEPKVRFDSTGDRGVKIVVSYTFQVTNLPEELR